MSSTITPGSLYRDTVNFFCHQRINIIIMAIITSFITMSLSHILYSYTDDEKLQIILGVGGTTTGGASNNILSIIDIIQKMSFDQWILLLRISAIRIFIILMGHTLMLGGMLNLITMVSSGENANSNILLLALEKAISQFPRLLILLLLTTIISQLGFIVLIAPGIILTILLALSPIIMIREKKSILAAIRASTEISCRYNQLVTPAVLLWFLGKCLILLLATTFLIALPMIIATAILNVIHYIINAVLTIYLYRLYMLVK
ncbi:MAG: YciC family protein [Candidatus Dasytiphilus stammeri]